MKTRIHTILNLVDPATGEILVALELSSTAEHTREVFLRLRPLVDYLAALEASLPVPGPTASNA